MSIVFEKIFNKNISRSVKCSESNSEIVFIF